MSLNTYPNNPFPPSTEQIHKGDNEELQAQIDSLKSGFTNLDNEVNGDATVYPYADVITIEDAVPSNLAECSVKIEPVQDLHGQAKPWVGGAGKNKLPLVLADIKAANTTGTWNDNVYSINDGTITVNTDSDGNVVSIKANGTFSAVISFVLWTKAGIPYPFENTSYTMNGCSGGSGSTYKQDVFYRKSGVDTVLLTATNGDAIADFSVLNDETVSVAAARIVIYAGTLTNQMFYPMIRFATETDATFAPYTNISPISGHTEASVEVTDGDETTKTYTIALGSTIYGGTVDFNTGVMTVTMAQIASYDGETIGEPWISDRDVYADGTTPTIGAQVVYPLSTPTTIQLTPQQIQLLKGTNTLTASTGQISVTVNGVSGAIGQVQEQVNDIVADLAKQLPTAPTTDGTYTLTVTVADGTPTYSWVSGS